MTTPNTNVAVVDSAGQCRCATEPRNPTRVQDVIVTRAESCPCGSSSGRRHEHCAACGALLCIRHSEPSTPAMELGDLDYAAAARRAIRRRGLKR